MFGLAMVYAFIRGGDWEVGLRAARNVEVGAIASAVGCD